MNRPPGERVTVLVVDDDPAMRALLRDWLERAGYHVLESESAEQFLAEAQRVRAGAVILDKEMPGLGGLEALRRLRRQGQDAPVILVTAFGGQRVADEALRLGAQAYLEKPFSLGALLREVRAATGWRREGDSADD